MTEYLDRDDVLTAGSAALGSSLTVADYGLLDAAIARPQATIFGVDAYPDHFRVDGNERTAWAAAWTFLYINGIRLGDFDVDDAEVFMNDVATRADLNIDAIAGELAGYARGDS